MNTINNFGYQCAAHIYYYSCEYVLGWFSEPMICTVGIMSVNLFEKRPLNGVKG